MFCCKNKSLFSLQVILLHHKVDSAKYLRVLFRVDLEKSELKLITYDNDDNKFMIKMIGLDSKVSFF